MAGIVNKVYLAEWKAVIYSMGTKNNGFRTMRGAGVLPMMGYTGSLPKKGLPFLGFRYCWFSHDVTKIQTKKLSILLRFYFHDVLEQLKTNFHTNFRFKRVLGFVIEYAWISKLLRNAAFTWRPRELSCRFKKWPYFRKFCYLNISCIRKSIS